MRADNVAFFALVALAVMTQTAYKLSQREGNYEYNTMSAMCVVEFIKLGMSVFHQYKDSNQDWSKVRDAARGIPHRVIVAYALLALSYAVYNQLIFVIMFDAEPGTFALLKSFTPVIVSFLNWLLYGHVLTTLQIFAMVIQFFGIIPVVLSKNDDTDCSIRLSYDPQAILVMIFAVSMASLNTVYNATMIKKESAPVAVQNMVLYSFGVLSNFLFYCLFSRSDRHFFYGYNQMGVIFLLLSNSLVGISITMIYKYGDAVLKTLTAPLAASILVFLSHFFFGMPLDLINASGAAVVVLATLLYLKLPSSPVTTKTTSTTTTTPTTSPQRSWHIAFAMLAFIGVGGNIISMHMAKQVMSMQNSS
jgi:drug/metabolite transporter (DMT)-like permease